MVLTPSTMMPLGTVAPDFSLQDTVSGDIRSLAELKSGTATVIVFMCNHCPFVKHILDQLVTVAREYTAKGVSFIAINANDVENYPEDSPEKMKELAAALDFPFPYLFDEAQDVAKAYQAACTPDFFIFDQDLKCVYRGQFDASRPGNTVPPTGEDITTVLEALLAGKPAPQDQKPSIGCNIKWKE